MSVELHMLLYAVVLLQLLVLIQSGAGGKAKGMTVMSGARDDLGPPTIFQARTKRVVDNHREGLIIFAPIVIAAALAHISNHWTVLGSELFFYSRVVHAGLYLAAVPHIRPFAWLVGLAGTIMVLLAALGVIS